MSSEDILSFGGLPKVVLMGLRKSGKSSIRKVVFEKVPPQETMYLPVTVKVETENIDKNTFVKFQVCDFPGQLNPFDPQNRGQFDPKRIFQNCGAIVFVMDCDQHLEESQKRLLETIQAAYEFKAQCVIEVFMHKVDSLEQGAQIDLHTKVKRYIDDGLSVLDKSSRGGKDGGIPVHYHFTTIYDHSVFSAFSLVVQELIKRQAPYINELLTMLCNRSQLEFGFLLDRTSKIYLSKSDGIHPDCYVFVRDAVELLEDLSDVYTHSDSNKQNEEGNNRGSANFEEGVGSSSDTNKDNGELTNGSLAGDPTSKTPVSLSGHADTVIRFSGRKLLYVKQLGPSLVLAAMISEEQFQNRAMIDFNINIFGQSVTDIFEAAEKRK